MTGRVRVPEFTLLQQNKLNQGNAKTGQTTVCFKMIISGPSSLQACSQICWDCGGKRSNLTSVREWNRSCFALSPFFVHRLHVVHPHAEDENVFLSGFFGHLHIGPVHGADGESAVQHELHVARSRGFCAGCGDLL